MLNPRLIKVYGEGSRDLLNTLVSDLGADLAAKCYVSVEEHKKVNGVMMPVLIFNATGHSDEIKSKITRFKSMYGLRVQYVRSVPNGCLQLYLDGEDYRRHDMYETSELMYSTAEKEMMQKSIIHALGDIGGLGYLQSEIPFINKCMFINLITQYLCTLDIGVGCNYKGDVYITSVDALLKYCGNDTDKFNLIMGIIQARNNSCSKFGLSETTESVFYVWSMDEFRDLCESIGVVIHRDNSTLSAASIMAGE